MYVRLRRTKRASSLLLYFCSGPASKKKRYLEDEPAEGGPLEDKPWRRPRPICSSSSIERSSIGLINKRDPAHGQFWLDIAVKNLKLLQYTSST
ncbi:hypothetical protein FQA39_LY07984 [Lamprigera yunnana]|nr:hypothetical protein FQA39_LY07984 [Lamprigera yunnana]